MKLAVNVWSQKYEKYGFFEDTCRKCSCFSVGAANCVVCLDRKVNMATLERKKQHDEDRIADK